VRDLKSCHNHNYQTLNKNLFNEECVNNLSKEETFEAIKQGVKEAFLEMMESGNGYSGIVRTDQVMEAIKNGVEDAIFGSMPGAIEIEEGIRHAVYNAMIESIPGPFEIREALRNGHNE
jgi:replicative superfamily II helicase